MIVLIVLALSVVALLWAVMSFEQNQLMAGYLAVIGLIAMTMSAYVLLQSRRRVTSVKIENPAMMTTIECRKCGTKNVREYQRGDYVFKDLGPCQKCDDKMLITAIYKEIKEKEKTFSF
jgi:hypothetical protein